MLTLPTHIFVTYETPECITFCSAVVGYIRQTPVVLLIERDENVHTSITNAIAQVVATARDPVIEIYRKAALDIDTWVPPNPDDIVWFEGYEYRINDVRHIDPAIMRIDVESETWVPIEAETLDALAPFLAAFKALPKSHTPLTPR
jgi:hypothetical protein